MSTDHEDERLSRIEARQDKMEAKHELTLEKIFDKINALTIALTKQSCPSPGACVDLGKSLHSSMLRMECLESRILSIEKWQNKVIGIGSALIVVVTLFGPSIRHFLKLG